MSALRASADHTTVLRAGLTRAGRALLASWRDEGAGQFGKEVLQPLDREADRLAQAIAAADARIDTALVALRRAQDA